MKLGNREVVFGREITIERGDLWKNQLKIFPWHQAKVRLKGLISLHALMLLKMKMVILQKFTVHMIPN